MLLSPGVPAAASSARIALSLLPVLAFLAGLFALDTFKLLRLRTILTCLAIGAAAAFLCMAVNLALHSSAPPGSTLYGIALLPLIEETAKAAYLAWLIRANRVGFMVDAAICGFAIGTGFALVENAYYLQLLDSHNLLLWAVRGLGTAMMHGAATALVGIVAMRTASAPGALPVRPFLQGLFTATLIHTFYNLGVLPPMASALVILLGLPALVIAVFIRSENALRSWVNDKLDQDIDLLSMLSSGDFLASNAGRYLQSLRGAFPPEVLGDMLCYLQLNLELRVQAKGELLRKEMNLPPSSDPELPSKLRELAFLERSIGRAGRLALAPLMPRSSRDLWELTVLTGKQGTDR